MAGGGPFGVVPGVVVGAGVVVLGSGVAHGPDRGQDGVLDGDEGLLGPRRAAIRRYFAAR